MTHPRVLLVEDEPTVAEPLAFLLTREGFIVTTAATGAQALELFHTQPFDLILLDVMLPEIPGTEVCRTIRDHSSVPIIMVTAKSAEGDKLQGFDLGADDYVTKPFSAKELIARARAVLRRRVDAAPATAQPPATKLTSRDLVLNLSRHELTRNGNPITLPRKEFHLLKLLMEHQGTVVPRAELIAKVWGDDYVGDTKTLDVHIKRLRAKIEDDPKRPTHLLTIRGIGYQLET